MKVEVRRAGVRLGDLPNNSWFIDQDGDVGYKKSNLPSDRVGVVWFDVDGLSSCGPHVSDVWPADDMVTPIESNSVCLTVG